MKKYLILSFLSFHLISTAQVAKDNTEFIRTGALEAKILNIGPGCRIKIDIPIGAKLGQGYQDKHYRGMAGFKIKMPPNFSNDGGWGFDFRCYSNNEKQFQEIWEEISPKDLTDLKVEDKRKKIVDEDKTTFIYVKALNASGWALTFDDTTGEERFRSRYLRYCLKSQESAICGISTIGYIDFLENEKNIDVTSYALEILESMEFLEDVPPN